MECSPKLNVTPKHLDVKRDRGITIQWSDGSVKFYSVVLLRKQSPSADARQLREEMARNPLTVLPAGAVGSSKDLTIENVEPVGHYALRIIFSDGHDTGIYSWPYLWNLPGEASSVSE
ncbi:MAG TPA: hypothetical protein DCM28_05490 [Phycisphaerales bacterium]|nr:hypothetical protein [Phycisphaerales bacterium]HCD32078.1 hypothetical protein [Phycisphaerales bacterium]|tara:strand:+ start:751 stop:1104 length:354 start_codon:yes stop_codon:yes gene_type:complete